jgi:hypothetical protein
MSNVPKSNSQNDMKDANKEDPPPLNPLSHQGRGLSELTADG